MLRVHSYESLGVYDGPGLRLVVFLQGCNFSCLYCANPDTIPIGKGGKLVPYEEILRRALNEKPFFGKKGGITFSGGEPTMQAKELLEMCKILKENNVHICIDSNGGRLDDTTKELFKLVDMVLLDCKEYNNIRHKTITGVENKKTIETAHYLNEIAKPVRLRYVLVPGYSNFKEDVEALCKDFSSFTNIDRVEVLPYHTFGLHKYEELNIEYKLKGVEEPSYDQIREIMEVFEQYFPNVWTQYE